MAILVVILHGFSRSSDRRGSSYHGLVLLGHGGAAAREY